MSFFTREKAFYRTFFPLLAVISMQQLTAIAVGVADNVMLGRYSELALSGAALSNQVFFFMQQLPSGLGMGLVVLGAQYWGRRETGPIRKTASLGMLLSLLLGFVFFIFSAATPYKVLGLLTGDEAVAAEGALHLRISSWAFLLFALSCTLQYSLQSVETAFVGTVMSLSALALKILLNYALVYGRLAFRNWV
jgi:Na+-driven multidrug efflux pump